MTRLPETGKPGEPGPVRRRGPGPRSEARTSAWRGRRPPGRRLLGRRPEGAPGPRGPQGYKPGRAAARSDPEQGGFDDPATASRSGGEQPNGRGDGGPGHRGGAWPRPWLRRRAVRRRGHGGQGRVASSASAQGDAGGQPTQAYQGQDPDQHQLRPAAVRIPGGTPASRSPGSRWFVAPGGRGPGSVARAQAPGRRARRARATRRGRSASRERKGRFRGQAGRIRAARPGRRRAVRPLRIRRTPPLQRRTRVQQMPRASSSNWPARMGPRRRPRPGRHVPRVALRQSRPRPRQAVLSSAIRKGQQVTRKARR